MLRYLLIFAMAVSLATHAFAQPDPNAPAQGGQQPGGRGGMGGGMGNMGSSVLDILPQGIFVLRSGALAKLDKETLAPLGTLELFGPMTERPQMPQNPTDQDRANMRTWMTQNMTRFAPASMLAKDGKIYIVVGTNCFCVNAVTMALLGKVDLAKPGDNANGRGMFNMFGGTPELKLDGNTLFVILGQELVLADPINAKVVQRVTLPKELFPAMQGFNFGGGRGNAGGGGRGNRGGGGAAGAGAAGGDAAK